MPTSSQPGVPKCFVTLLVFSMALFSLPNCTETAEINCFSCSETSKSNPSDLDKCVNSYMSPNVDPPSSPGSTGNGKEEVCDDVCSTVLKLSGPKEGVKEVKKGCLDQTTRDLFRCIWKLCGHQDRCITITSGHVFDTEKIQECFQTAGWPLWRQLTTGSGDNDPASSQPIDRDIHYPIVTLCQCDDKDRCNEVTAHIDKDYDTHCPPDPEISATSKALKWPSSAMLPAIIFSALNSMRDYC